MCSRWGANKNRPPTIRRCLHSLKNLRLDKKTPRLAKLSFSRLLSNIIHHLEIDFMFVAELGNLSILHMKDAQLEYLPQP